MQHKGNVIHASQKQKHSDQCHQTIQCCCMRVHMLCMVLIAMQREPLPPSEEYFKKQKKIYSDSCFSSLQPFQVRVQSTKS